MIIMIHEVGFLFWHIVYYQFLNENRVLSSNKGLFGSRKNV